MNRYQRRIPSVHRLESLGTCQHLYKLLVLGGINGLTGSRAQANPNNFVTIIITHLGGFQVWGVKPRVGLSVSSLSMQAET